MKTYGKIFGFIFLLYALTRAVVGGFF